MHKHLLFLIPLAAFLTSCATHQPAPATKTEAPAAPLQYESRALADLLVAEVALQRDQYNLALDYYEHHAARSVSTAISEQTALLALHAQDANKALQQAQKWLQQAPNNSTAHEVAALSLILLERPNEAAKHVSQLLQQDEKHGLNSLIAHSQGLNEKGSILLLSSLSQLAEEYPKQSALWYARAMYLQQQGNPKAALTALNKALRITPEHYEANMLKGQLLFETGRRQASYRHMQALIKNSPKPLRARALYTRLLLTANENKKAIQALDAFTEAHPDEQDLRFSMVLFALDRGAMEAAIHALRSLLAEDYRQRDMHLYLALAYEQVGDNNAALAHYNAVADAEADLQTHFQRARLYHLQKNYEQSQKILRELHQTFPEQAITLYIAEAELWAEEQPRHARELIDTALRQHPRSDELLYYSAMLAEQDNDIATTEARLKQILAFDPHHANALNALGYVLTNHTRRYAEANGYITQALAQEPDNAAFLDSKGWVLFHLGDLKNALYYLQRAYEELPEDEVAEHLIATLTALGHHKEAKAIKKQHPELAQ